MTLTKAPCMATMANRTTGICTKAHEPPSVGLPHSMQARWSSSLQAGLVFQWTAAAYTSPWTTEISTSLRTVVELT